jgi:hypothetical protein
MLFAAQAIVRTRRTRCHPGGALMRIASTRFLSIPAALAAVALAAPVAAETVHARLIGFEEVPAVSSPGSGEFKAKIDRKAGSIFYELSYSGLQGNITQAHIHFGQHGVNGGISVWLCGTAALPGPPGTPACAGTTDGTVNGTLTAANVIGPGGQLIAAGELDELLDAIRAGVAYVNVHTTAVGAGEIRGQLGGKGHAGGKH